MAKNRYLPLLVLTVFTATAWAGNAKREPHIGYLYPAGGKQGSSIMVMAGGQLLRGVTDVYVSGKGVSASVIKYYKPVRNLMQDQRIELIRRLVAAKDKRLAELPGKAQREYLPLPGEYRLRQITAKKRNERRIKKGKDAKKPAPVKTGPVELPEHPLLEGLESKSLREIYHVASAFLNWQELKRKQLNRQLMEMALIDVTIEPGAPPGDREIRFKTPLGLTSPVCFQVGTLPELCELEPNDTRAFTNLPEAPPVNIPVVLNGQVMPGDIDRFRFRARRGQKLVIKADARRLVPFLADAVPGWFQATMTLFDANKREVAFADDFHFHPDPVLLFKVPADGEYELEIRDAIYRGREDFVYRISVGEIPFISRMYPLGAKAGSDTVATLYGWHLTRTRLKLDTKATGVHQSTPRQGSRAANEVLYAVDDLPEVTEREPNGTLKAAQKIILPRLINGRILKSGDVDMFQFKGRGGEEVVAEVTARRLHSPLDSLLRITDATGKVLAWNDDNLQKEGHLHRDMGFLTHHSDSYVRTRLPKDGTYYVHIADTRSHGSEAHAYRLRISLPRPDFVLQVSPSSLTVPASGVVPLTVHVLRKDGFKDDINLVLKNPPQGFSLEGTRIPNGRSSVRVTLTAGGQPLAQPVKLRMEGQVRRASGTMTRPAIPTDNVMQAFLWRHLAPSQDIMIAFSRARKGRHAIRVATPRVRIPAGGSAEVRLSGPRKQKGRTFKLMLSEPPKGISLEEVRYERTAAVLKLKAEGDALKPGYADNLIVEAFIEYEMKARGKKDEKKKKKKRKGLYALGVLPAIPFEIVQP